MFEKDLLFGCLLNGVFQELQKCTLLLFRINSTMMVKRGIKIFFNPFVV